jgi:hypothetical protein
MVTLSNRSESTNLNKGRIAGDSLDGGEAVTSSVEVPGALATVAEGELVDVGATVDEDNGSVGANGLAAEGLVVDVGAEDELDGAELGTATDGAGSGAAGDLVDAEVEALLEVVVTNEADADLVDVVVELLKGRRAGDGGVAEGTVLESPGALAAVAKGEVDAVTAGGDDAVAVDVRDRAAEVVLDAVAQDELHVGEVARLDVFGDLEVLVEADDVDGRAVDAGQLDDNVVVVAALDARGASSHGAGGGEGGDKGGLEERHFE